MEISDEQRHYLSSQRVLCVEDDDVVLKATVDVMRCVFGEVYQAGNGHDAWELYKAYHPRYVYTDIAMPKSGGLEFARKVKEDDPKSCVVFITGNTDKKTLIDVIRVAPDGFLEKPFSVDDLLGSVAELVKGHLGQHRKSVWLSESIHLDLANACVIRNGRYENLTSKEVRLMELLLQNPNRLVSYAQIEAYVWGGEGMTESSLKSLIYRVRNKVCKECIRSISGIGLRIGL